MEILLGLFGIAVVVTPFILGLVNFSRISSLLRRIELLEIALVRQDARIEELVKKPVPHEEKAAPPELPAELEQPIQQPAMSVPQTSAVDTPAEAPKLVEEPVATFSEQPVQQTIAPPEEYSPRELFEHHPIKPSRTQSEWEALIGGKILNRIGALALIIGMGFFLKYAFDNNWINETTRVLIGVVAGIGLLVGAARTKRKGFEIFSQGLVGAGIAILYLCVYAAFNYYHLIPQLVAFVLMSCVTTLTLWQAIKYDSIAVGILGWAGGFLTPFMLSTGQANEVGLFTYLALLSAGLLAVVLAKEKWIILETLTIAATYLIYFLWFNAAYKLDAQTAAIFFVSLFWILFWGIEATRNLKETGLLLPLRHAHAVANGLLFYIALYQLLEPELHAWTGAATFAIGVPYYFMYERLRKNPGTKIDVLVRYLLGASIFLFSAIAVQFSTFIVVTLWAVEGMALVYLGWKRTLMPSVFTGIVVFGAALFKLLFSYGALGYVPIEEFVLIFNLRALAFFVLSACVLISMEILIRMDDKSAALLAEILGYASCLVFAIGATAETVDFFGRSLFYLSGSAQDFAEFKRDLTVGVLWMALSLIMTWFGFWRARTAVRHSGMILLLAALFFSCLRSVSFDPIQSYSFILNYRVFALALLIAGIAGQIFLWKKYGSEVNRSEKVLTSSHIAAVLIIFILITSETYDGFEKLLQASTGNAYELLQFKRVLTLSIVWMAFSMCVTWYGVKKRMTSIMYIGIVATGLGVFVGLIRSAWYTPLDVYTPVLNFRFLAVFLLGLGLAGLLIFWRTTGKDEAISKSLTNALGLAVVALIFVLLTSETIDYYEHWIAPADAALLNAWDADLNASVNTLRNKQQLTLSAIWLVYSIVLMGIGIWRRRRNIRLVAIGLFGLTILKIFIYDLSFLETLYRIFSFMGLGVILLGVSYLYQKYKSIILETEPDATAPPDAAGTFSG